MASIDIIVESEYPDEVLSNTVANILHLNPNSVLVIHDYSEYPQADASQVVCNIQRFQEGFRQLVTIDFYYEFDINLLGSGIASVLQTRCLIPSDDLNPYAMKLFMANGDVIDVYLDVSALDDKDIYLID